ncbi:MAG: hypothetical protein QXF00_06195 [Desulfurococcaceae archaeon]
MVKAVVKKRNYSLFIRLILRHLLVSKLTILLALTCVIGSAMMTWASLSLGLSLILSLVAMIALFIAGTLLHELVHFIVLDTDVSILINDHLIRLEILNHIPPHRLYLATVAGPLTPTVIGLIVLKHYPEYFLALTPLLLQSISIIPDLGGILGLMGEECATSN